MQYNNHDLIWTCPSCEKKNIELMHSDPDAHFVSMNCEYCDEEYDGCLCDFGEIVEHGSPAQLLGRRGGIARANNLTPAQRSASAKKAGKKRWS